MSYKPISLFRVTLNVDIVYSISCNVLMISISREFHRSVTAVQRHTELTLYSNPGKQEGHREDSSYMIPLFTKVILNSWKNPRFLIGCDKGQNGTLEKRFKFIQGLCCNYISIKNCTNDLCRKFFLYGLLFR
jgi:hypothetical protein